MTWRMKIAYWISGGDLSRHREDNTDLNKHLDACFHYEEALIHIAHMRTPRCASIGNRMADIAEEALK